MNLNKVKIKLSTIGHMPIEFDAKKISNWKSSVFEIVSEIDNYSLRCDSDGPDWEFSDDLIKEQLPKAKGADFYITIVNVPIEDNWYSRRLGDNQVVFTFHEIRGILEHYNIPLENVIYRLLYAYTLLYKRSGDRIYSISSGETSFTHDETRGCLFDMNGIKTDLVASCANPIICDECQERLKKEKVPERLISDIVKEIKYIRKDLYFRIFDYVKKHPVYTLILSSLFALAIGVTGSILASFVYDRIKI